MPGQQPFHGGSSSSGGGLQLYEQFYPGFKEDGSGENYHNGDVLLVNHPALPMSSHALVFQTWAEIGQQSEQYADESYNYNWTWTKDSEPDVNGNVTGHMNFAPMGGTSYLHHFIRYYSNSKLYEVITWPADPTVFGSVVVKGDLPSTDSNGAGWLTPSQISWIPVIAANNYMTSLSFRVYRVNETTAAFKFTGGGAPFDVYPGVWR